MGLFSSKCVFKLIVSITFDIAVWKRSGRSSCKCYGRARRRWFPWSWAWNAKTMSSSNCNFCFLDFGLWWGFQCISVELNWSIWTVGILNLRGLSVSKFISLIDNFFLDYGCCLLLFLALAVCLPEQQIFCIFVSFLAEEIVKGKRTHSLLHFCTCIFTPVFLYFNYYDQNLCISPYFRHECWIVFPASSIIWK